MTAAQLTLPRSSTPTILHTPIAIMILRIPRLGPLPIHLLSRPLRPLRPLRRLLSTAPQELPPTAPKPTPNIRSICESADYHRQNCLNRNYPALSTAPSCIVSLHEEITALQRSLRSDREAHNALTTLIKQHSTTPAAKDAALTSAKALKDKITIIEEQEKHLTTSLQTLALSLPNTTHPSTPIGTTPTLLTYLNPHLSTTPWSTKTPHTTIGADLDLLDFTSANTVSGWGWYYLLNDAVLLEQALINYALTLARQHGWKPVSPPSIIYSHIASAAGFRPRDQHGEQQIYTLDSAPGKFSHSLAGTAEIPLAGLYANKVIPESDLPLKLVGTGRAYRAEAGARGVESKGLYRVHEFTKVELFSWTTPDAEVAEEMFNEMLEFQKSFIASLGLYARVLEMPTGDLGASAYRKVDVEVYMPSREKKDPWGEVSSLSCCTDYQSRRLNTKVKMGSGGRDFVWTLNGTAVAVPRVLMALLEYGYEDGVVRVPEVLRPFMGGMEVIGRR